MYLVNTTCRGLCPRAKGYYIGLKRFFDESNQTKWIWSNNVTWTQHEISVNSFLLTKKQRILRVLCSSAITYRIQMQIPSAILTEMEQRYFEKQNKDSKMFCFLI